MITTLPEFMRLLSLCASETSSGRPSEAIEVSDPIIVTVDASGMLVGVT